MTLRLEIDNVAVGVLHSVAAVGRSTKKSALLQDAAARARGEILPVASEDRIVLFSSIK